MTWLIGGSTDPRRVPIIVHMSVTFVSHACSGVAPLCKAVHIGWPVKPSQ